MTFREKLAKEHPERISIFGIGGCEKCPCSYGYEEEFDCSGMKNCKECWDREIPTEPKEDMDKEDYENLGYIKGLQDAWELAKKIATVLTTSERAKIFGYVVDGITVTDILRSFAPQEALAKLKAYEEEIKVGDVVETLDASHKGVVTLCRKVKKDFFVMWDNGTSDTYTSHEVKKTDRHFDITSLLGQIRGE
jgi:hypothetical protein